MWASELFPHVSQPQAVSLLAFCQRFMYIKYTAANVHREKHSTAVKGEVKTLM